MPGGAPPDWKGTAAVVDGGPIPKYPPYLQPGLRHTDVFTLDQELYRYTSVRRNRIGKQEVGDRRRDRRGIEDLQ